MKTTVLCFLAALAVACGSATSGDDAGADAIAPTDAATEATAEGGSCGAPGSPCENPLDCCSHGCQGKALDDGGQITICK